MALKEEDLEVVKGEYTSRKWFVMASLNTNLPFPNTWHAHDAQSVANPPRTDASTAAIPFARNISHPKCTGALLLKNIEKTSKQGGHLLFLWNSNLKV